MISEPLLFLSPADLAGCRQRTSFCSLPPVGEGQAPLTCQLELGFPGLEKKQQHGQWPAEKAPHGAWVAGNGSVETWRVQGKKQSNNIYGTLILGCGHLEGEKDHGFILLISLPLCMFEICHNKKYCITVLGNRRNSTLQNCRIVNK